MADTLLARLAQSRRRDLRRSVGAQLQALREDRGLSQREVCAAVGVDRSVLSRAEAGDANLTLDALAAIATALGAEPSLRLYGASGPRVRDRVQLRLVEALVRELHPRWQVRPSGGLPVAAAPATFAAACPGPTETAVAALTTADGQLPPAAIVWVEVRGTAARLLQGPPRGVVAPR